MMCPVGADIHQIDIVTTAQFLIAFQTRIAGRLFKALFHEKTGGILHFLRKHVANGDNLCPGDIGIAVNRERTPGAQSDETDTDRVNRPGPEPDDMFLPFRTGRDFRPDDSITAPGFTTGGKKNGRSQQADNPAQHLSYHSVI